MLAEALFIARRARAWPERPFWMLRRCVVPYVTARQFLVLRDPAGLAMAFAGWVWEREGLPAPWRESRYLPSATDFLPDGRCCVCELIAVESVEPPRVLDAVGRWLRLDHRPAWIERDAEHRIAAQHPAQPLTPGA